jgi:putative hydrolase of the HAD superfamily
MVGNSFKSDIAPALSIGCSAIHIPAQSIWAHEKTEEYEHPKLRRISYFKEILDWI